MCFAVRQGQKAPRDNASRPSTVRQQVPVALRPRPKKKAHTRSRGCHQFGPMSNALLSVSIFVRLDYPNLKSNRFSQIFRRRRAWRRRSGGGPIAVLDPIAGRRATVGDWDEELPVPVAPAMRLRLSEDLLSLMGLVYRGSSQPPVTLAASGCRYRCWGNGRGCPFSSSPTTTRGGRRKSRSPPSSPNRIFYCPAAAMVSHACVS